jgi:hypothetical protein
MRLSASDLVLDRQDYAARRAAARDRMIPLRRERRLRLGDQVACEFENAETLLYQVQEMVYAEGISDADEASAEIDAYARMLPSSHELCCTLFIELDDVSTVKEELSRLAGLHKALSIEVGGERVPGVELPGEAEAGPSEETYAVHFLRFRFSDEARDTFRNPDEPASLVVDHPAYADEMPIEGSTRLALLADLALP